MSVLFFFPWVASRGELQLGELSMIPYEREQAPREMNGVSQEIIDAIIGNYGDVAYPPQPHAFTNIRQATLLRWNSDADGLELSENQIFDRLEQARYIAFSALAQRRFCSHDGYCNAAGYEVIAQRFVVERPGSISIAARRRDGFTQTYISRTSSPRFIRPEHVDSRLLLGIDEALLCALLGLPPSEFKDQIDDAIATFLLANSDSPAIPAHTELVLLRSAFEALLDASHRASDLRTKFGDHFANELPNPPQWETGVFTETVWRDRWPQNTRPLDAWVQDFCNARNSAAHGSRVNGQPSIWGSQDHLLFSSWLFPLMVKKVLTDAGLYQLREEDLAARRGCEAFLAHDLLSRIHENSDERWWNRIESKILHSILSEILLTLIEPENKQ
ncbi:hypothetical protein [Pseudomonas koreensis]|uniref:hypothetical protein n=1 Tax=Pseudomonas koreensis TaxID=198620 RepID=UPI001B32BDF2|nr:hypothetical protein [Pseudomonas koreensis]MBP4001375.1 hypothetical protein [Pseudomonas koreensis]